MDEFDSNDEIDLIVHVLLKVNDVGEKTAIAIARYYETLDNFLNANFLTLSNIITVNGRRIVRESSMKGILEVVQDIPKGYSVKEIWIRVLVKDFLDTQVSMLENISLNSLTINPFLVRALELNNPTEVIRFNLYQHVTRSIVTSWGFCVERILRYTGAEDIPEAKTGFDIQKVYEDIIHYIQIKSSPNSMNVDMVRWLNRKVKELEERDSGYRPLLGLTFGRKEQVAGQITGNIDLPEYNILVGKELWDFISEETNFHCKVLDTISEVTGGVLPRSFSDMVDEKFKELLVEWIQKYGDGESSVDKVVDELF